jgi:hypothetical protein
MSQTTKDYLPSSEGEIVAELLNEATKCSYIAYGFYGLKRRMYCDLIGRVARK